MEATIVSGDWTVLAVAAPIVGLLLIGAFRGARNVVDDVSMPESDVDTMGEDQHPPLPGAVVDSGETPST